MVMRHGVCLLVSATLLRPCCSETRAAGTAINTFTNLLMTFVIGQTFLSMLCAMKFGVSELPTEVHACACITADSLAALLLADYLDWLAALLLRLFDLPFR
jgi:hypothetical protein